MLIGLAFFLLKYINNISIVCYYVIIYCIIVVYIAPHLKELAPRTARSAELICFNLPVKILILDTRNTYLFKRQMACKSIAKQRGLNVDKFEVCMSCLH